MSNREGIIKQAGELVLLAADWLFPKECVGCGAEGAWLCAACRPRISWQPYQTCLVCGAETEGQICPGHLWSLDKVIAAADYNDLLIKDLIKICKYHFSREAANDLADLLGQFWQKQNFPPLNKGRVGVGSSIIIIPAPLSRRRLNWRGFNQAAILARALATNLSLDYDDKNLVKKINTRPQVSLSGRDRQRNLNGCFAWRGEPLADRTILLVDDVATTGATLNECAKVLKQAGAQRVWGIVVAR
jgi:ComF family protein